jgi:hypothetical protein
MNARASLFAWMTAMVAVGSVAAAELPSDWPSEGQVSSPHRSLKEMRHDVHAALRAEALSRREGENAPAVIRLVDLYRELAAHPQRDESTVITQLGLKLRARLRNVSDRIERQIDRSDRDVDKKEGSPARVLPETHVLAQQIAVPGGAGPGQGGQAAAGQSGVAQTIDYGPQLVDVIQQTISPATWDINGGNGAVVYFAPLRVLVVSAPGSVHDEISDVLGQLRAAP